MSNFVLKWVLEKSHPIDGRFGVSVSILSEGMNIHENKHGQARPSGRSNLQMDVSILEAEDLGG